MSEGVLRNVPIWPEARLATPQRKTVMSASAFASDEATPAGDIVLHVWPGAFGLASIEPTCLAAVLYLRLVIPDKFVVEESTTPDYSPNGTR